MYKRVLFLLPDVIIRSAFEAGVRNFVTWTRYSFARAHAAVVRASELDWAQSDGPGWYHNEYRTANVREVALKHDGDGSYRGTKPRAREVKEPSLFKIKAKFDQENRKPQKQLSNTLATPVDEGPRVESSVGEEIGSVMTNDIEVQVASCNDDVGKMVQLIAIDVDENVMRMVLSNFAQKRRTARRVVSWDVREPTKSHAIVWNDDSFRKSCRLPWKRVV